MRNDPISLAAPFRQHSLGTADPLPSSPDDAVAEIMARLADPAGTIAPAEIWRELARRNEATRTAAATEIRSALTRQAALLEAMTTRFAHMAVTAPKASQTESWTRLSLGCSRALVSVLGALHAVTKDDVPAEVVDGN